MIMVKVAQSFAHKKRLDQERAMTELKQPWNSRNRVDKQVTGTIELAFARGYHAGWQDCKKKHRPMYFVGE
jgi:hypothetical protein